MIRTTSRSVPRPRAVRRAATPPLAVLVAMLAATAATAAAAPRILLRDDGGKPAESGLVRALTAFDCAGRDTFTLTAAVAETVLDSDTTGGPSQLPSYACLLWSEAGPEHIYRLEVTEDLQLWAGLSGLGDNDLDLFLLDGCDSDRCLTGANTELQAVLPAGTYWLVVDGYGSGTGAAGPYTLTLRTRWPGVPPQVCAEGGAEPVACDGALITRPGGLFDAADLVQAYDCSPSQVPGGEAWYAMTLPGQQQVAVRATPDPGAPQLDLVLWLFDGCGAAAQCLQHADARAGGGYESLTYENTGTDPVTVYLAVDARHAPVSAEAGVFAVAFQCQSNVPTESSGFGSMKALFR
jgi:hypothetical protein